ncbi:MAG: VapC toxin family PIN domain ribonuclease [Gammaproteobacteria bacterium]|nr:VapC toxin family PIN domain ribonuclease [Gammaproteobacteria bacterium]
MIHLLDVNVLIALAWPSHVHHRLAQEWFKGHRHQGWATCPLTQTGFVRISSNPRFIDGAVTPGEALDLLRQVTRSEDHHFWADSVDVTQEPDGLGAHLLGHRQVTDAYLLILAIANQGALATLDSDIAALLPTAAQHSPHLALITATS